MSNLPGMIAQKLWDAGIRLRDQEDFDAMSHKGVDQRLKDQIAALMLEHGRSIEFEVSTDRIQAMGVIDAVNDAAFEHAQIFMGDAVDEELWILQCRAGHDAWVDAQIDNIKDGRSAA